MLAVTNLMMEAFYSNSQHCQNILQKQTIDRQICFCSDKREKIVCVRILAEFLVGSICFPPDSLNERGNVARKKKIPKTSGKRKDKLIHIKKVKL